MVALTMPNTASAPLPTATPTATPTAAACTDPTACNPVLAIPAKWSCNTSGCTDHDWGGSVITWPSWSAYGSNARTGSNSRTVYSLQDEPLYPYMGSWASGCQVTAVTGIVLIIEWQRGTDVWREIHLKPGESHTITLSSPEDGAMIESPDSSVFSVSLANCTPQQLQTPAAPAGAAEASGHMHGVISDEASFSQQVFLPWVTQ